MRPATRDALDGRREPASQPVCGEPDLRRIRSEALFGGERAIAIEHNRRLYTLRITTQGKLILTA